MPPLMQRMTRLRLWQIDAIGLGLCCVLGAAWYFGGVARLTSARAEQESLRASIQELESDRDRILKVERNQTGKLAEAVKDPQPEVHIRADKRARYEAVADTLAILQRGGMRKVGFIAEPPAGGG